MNFLSLHNLLLPPILPSPLAWAHPASCAPSSAILYKVWEPEKVNQIIFSSHYKCKWILSSLVNDMKSDLFWTSESYWASAEASVKLAKITKLQQNDPKISKFNLNFLSCSLKGTNKKNWKIIPLNWSWKKKHFFSTCF